MHCWRCSPLPSLRPALDIMQERVIQPLLDAVPQPALAIGADARILAANPGALTLLGHGIVGRNYATMIRQPSVLDAIERTLVDQDARVARYLGSDGAQDTIFDVSCRAAGHTGDILLCFDDVTEVEKAGQMRRDFVANVSHELRTPLTALMGFIDTLQGSAREDSRAQTRFLGVMKDEAERMNRLVGDLLSLSRVESDQRVRPNTEIALLDVLEGTLNALQPLATRAQVQLSLNAPDDRVQMVGDADQLRQVFTNLVENAIKYGASGERVDIDVTRVTRDPSLRQTAVRIDVTDFGPGIDPLHLPRLTERFYRADNHRNRDAGGTGLGLAIVKHIINRHRGRLKVKSTLGKGATFTVLLPISDLFRA